MKDVFTVLSPSHSFSRCLGFAPYTVTGPPRWRRVEFSRKYFVAAALLHVTCVIISFGLWSSAIDTMKSSTLLYVVGVVYIVFNYVLQILNVVLNKAYNSRTISVLRELHEIEKDLLSVGVVIDYDRLRKLSAAYTFLQIGFGTVYVPTYAIVTADANISLAFYAMSFVLYYYNYLTQSAIDCQFLVFFLIVGNMFGKLNERLRLRSHFRKTNFHVVSDLLNKMALAHQKLCDASREYNRVLSAQILVSFGLHFCSLLLEFFNVIVTTINKDFGQTQNRLSLPILLMVSTKLALHVITCSQCMHEANSTKNVLFNPAELDFSVGKTDRFQAKAISLQMIHEELKITAGGFFAIDYSFVTTIVGAIAVYTVILIQFDTDVDVYKTFLNHTV